MDYLLTAIVEAWTRYQREASEEDIWALDEMDALIKREAASAWQAVRMLCEVATNDYELCQVGSGPVEDLICQYGDDAVSELEKLIDQEPRLIKVAACVWAWRSPARSRVDRLLEKYERPRL